MFETEDMLPRPPPKPSAPPLSSEDSIKPEVPEVSILFGKVNNTTPIFATQQPPSYAAWKKQVLPLCSPGFKDQATVTTTCSMVTARSTVFPLRTTIIPATVSQVKKNEHLNTQSPVEKTFRHSLENASGPTPSLSNYIQSNEHRRSVDSLSQRSSAFSMERALTICASTQTDFPSADTKIAKQDFDCLIKAVNELQEEQQQTRRLLEAFMTLQEQQRQMIVSSVICCDAATQCNSLRDNLKLNVLPQNDFQLENGTVHQALPNVKIYSPVMKDVSRPVLPTAQSTQYRTNTPYKSNTQQLPLAKFATPTNPYVPTLPKACTERSMVMNELALKYLPSDKLNELMEDISKTGETTPLREIDNLNKAPTDISTASFHYLRKYRLLPHQQKQQNDGSPPQNDFTKSEPTLNQQHLLQKSPIVNAAVESPHLDLEHIKRQPKFL